MQPGLEVDQEARGHQNSRAFLLYAGIIAAATVVLIFVLKAGTHLHTRASGADDALATGGTAENLMWKLLLASALIVTVARLVGLAFQRINQPQVVGEIVAGVLL